ncbi:helix-turn-helix domain-containing protein [Streptomyces beijiangensis]
MAVTQLNAPPSAQYVVRHSPRGVAKLTEFQDPGFTIVGDHLSQHGEMSLTAIGLATHILSLPDGSPVDIRTLAAKFPEGRARVASALRELEAHGYLERVRQQTGGKWVTLTYSYNNPAATRARRAREAASSHTPSAPATPAPEEPAPAAPEPERTPEPEPAAPRPTAPAALPPVPQPAYPAPDLLRSATALLAGLQLQDPRLLLSAYDTEHLAPAVATWLERGATPAAVQRAMTANLPTEPLRRPAAFLAHRLTTELPPLPEFGAAPSTPDPFQTCDHCDRAFRSPTPVPAATADPT